MRFEEAATSMEHERIVQNKTKHRRREGLSRIASCQQRMNDIKLCRMLRTAYVKGGMWKVNCALLYLGDTSPWLCHPEKSVG